ncbi:hypothetical protein BKA83DRAFT_24008 [Pisolithus microcarpus]|nr:hypothetical protein BKA83DRAFT_24008 [Pisolithus microcarpus]
MTDYYWPRSLPTELHKDYITQVRYSIRPTDDEEVHQITQINFHDDEPVEKHRCFFPFHYFAPLTTFLWKYYLYIGLYTRFHGSRQKKLKRFLPHLLKCIVHLDNVIEAFIRPILSVPLDEIKDYRSQNFDEYIASEIILGRHDPESFKIFRSRCPINIERMKTDDFAKNWMRHMNRLPPLMEGEKYDYDIDMVPDEDWKVLLVEVQGWHQRKLDIEWITSCVQWEDDNGTIIYPPERQSSDNLDEGRGSYGIENPFNQNDLITIIQSDPPFSSHTQTMQMKEEDSDEGAGSHLERGLVGFDLSLVAGTSSGPSEDRQMSSIQSMEPLQGDDQTIDDKITYPPPAPPEDSQDLGYDSETFSGDGRTSFHAEETVFRDVHETDYDPKEPLETNPTLTDTNFPSEPPQDPESDGPSSSRDYGTGNPLLSDDPHDQIEVVTEPPTTKRSRRRPTGSTKKGKEKQTQRGSPFVTTRVLQSQTHHSSSELRYDKVVVTVSPRKQPVVTSGRSRRLREVSPSIFMPVAGPSSRTKTMIQNSSSSSDEETKDEVPSVLKNLPTMLQSLAKKGMSDAEDITDEASLDTSHHSMLIYVFQFFKLFSTLKDVSKMHRPQLCKMFSQIKADKHGYNNLIQDATRLEQQLRNDGKEVDMNVKKGYMILARECGLSKQT